MLSKIRPALRNGHEHLRIGEVGRRLGLSPDVIRAWERRYGIVAPSRSEGGTRLYSPDDLSRLQVMQRGIGAGMAPSEAARRAIAIDGEDSHDPAQTQHITGDIVKAIQDLDEPAAQDALDRLIATFSQEYALRDVLLPLYFGAVQAREPALALEPEQERFAVNVLRGRLLGLARGWGEGAGPLAILACPPGEHRDLAVICFGLSLRAHGWRVLFLGADTDVATLRRVGRSLRPDFVLVAASEPGPILRVEDDLRDLAREVPLAVVGRGLVDADADAIGAARLHLEPVTAAQRVAAGAPA